MAEKAVAVTWGEIGRVFGSSANEATAVFEALAMSGIALMLWAGAKPMDAEV